MLTRYVQLSLLQPTAAPPIFSDLKRNTSRQNNVEAGFRWGRLRPRSRISTLFPERSALQVAPQCWFSERKYLQMASATKSKQEQSCSSVSFVESNSTGSGPPKWIL